MSKYEKPTSQNKRKASTLDTNSSSSNLFSVSPDHLNYNEETFSKDKYTNIEL